MPVDWVEPESTHRARERVEAAAHVDGLDDDEDPDRRRQAQHAPSARTSRTTTASSKSLSSSIAKTPRRTTYRAAERDTGAGTSSTIRGDGSTT